MAGGQDGWAMPVWRPAAVDIGRRRTLVGLSSLVVAAIGGDRASAQDVRPCTVTADAGEGPFYFDPKLLRTDITAGKPGAPLQLTLQVVRAGDCATLANARVDVWHADAVGLYSGYAKQSGVGGVAPETAVGQQYLRGTQVTDPGGHVEFRTIVPSWYGGRTPHVHVKVFLGGNEVVASQVFFPDTITREVFAEWDPYRAHASKRKVFNDNDPIRQGVFSEVARSGQAYSATARLVVTPR